MYTVERALAKDRPPTKRAAYEISKETEEKVELIEFEVHNARMKYTEHRDLLQALCAKVARGETVTPKTLKEAADLLRHERTLRRWKHPLAMRQRDVDIEEAEPTTTDDPEPAEGTPRSTVSAALRDMMRQFESGVDEEFSDTTLGRDTVRERNEPPRRRQPR